MQWLPGRASLAKLRNLHLPPLSSIHLQPDGLVLATLVFICLAGIGSWGEAAKFACKQEPRVLPLEYGKVKLSVNYHPEVIIVGENFSLDVRIDYTPVDILFRGLFFQIIRVQFEDNNLITLRRILEPKHTREEENWVTTSSYIFEINEEANPGNKEGLITFQLGDRPPLEERFCIPIGSEGEDGEKYLTVKITPPLLALTWGASGEVALELLNTYPYTYTVTDVKSIPHGNTPYALLLPQIDPRNPVQVQLRDSSLRARVTAKYPWSSLLAVSNTPTTAELRLSYEDPYKRPVEEKPVHVNLIIIPPVRLLWVLALVGGLIGGVLHYFVSRPQNEELVLWKEVIVGVVVAMVVYALFQLGDIKIFSSKLDLTLDNNTGIIAFLLGVLAGWRGKGVLERLV